MGREKGQGSLSDEFGAATVIEVSTGEPLRSDILGAPQTLLQKAFQTTLRKRRQQIRRPEIQGRIARVTTHNP